jgi:hypothetical protein
MTTDFDLKALQSRINEIREEGEEITDFTYDFIECLIKRHCLNDFLWEETELEDVPDSILETIREGKVPSKDELILLSPDTQNFLCFELIWICGMAALACYGADDDGDEEEEEPSTLDVILSMKEESPAHYIASYLIAVMTLLMGQIPSQDLIICMTNDFDESEEQLQKNMTSFVELSSAVLTRYHEDLGYFEHVHKKENEETESEN